MKTLRTLYFPRELSFIQVTKKPWLLFLELYPDGHGKERFRVIVLWVSTVQLGKLALNPKADLAIDIESIWHKVKCFLLITLKPFYLEINAALDRFID